MRKTTAIASLVIRHLLFILIAGMASGCTFGLIQRSFVNDPPVEKVHGAYQSGNRLLLDYSVEDTYSKSWRGGGATKRLSSRYWAECDLSQTNPPPFDFVVHRRSISRRRIRLAHPLNVLDLREQRLQQTGRLTREQLIELIQTHGVEALDNPHLVIVRLNNLSEAWMIISKDEYHQLHNPFLRNIPLRNYPRLILLAPIAVATDIVVVIPLFLVVGLPYGF